jgi:hypothetical protein
LKIIENKSEQKWNVPNANANGEVFIKSLPLATRHKPVAFFCPNGHQGRLTRALLHGGRLPILALADRWTGKWALTTPTAEERRELVGCWHLPSYVIHAPESENGCLTKKCQSLWPIGQTGAYLENSRWQKNARGLRFWEGFSFYLQCLM